MANQSAATKWAVYESNVQQYRVLSATVQSFFLTVGSILYTRSDVPKFLMVLVFAIGMLHIWVVWFKIVKARHLIIDYYKFMHYQGLTALDIKKLTEECDETTYVHNDKKRREVNAKYFKRPDLRLWRETRLKLDIWVPTMYTVMWLGLFFWKFPLTALVAMLKCT